MVSASYVPTMSGQPNSGTVEELSQDVAFLTIQVTMRPKGNNVLELTPCITKANEQISPG